MALFVFIDASGSPGPKQGDPFVLSAVVIEESLMSGFESDVERLVWETLGSERAPEIHARDLIQNKGDFRGLPIETRARLLSEFVRLGCEYAGRGGLAGIVVVVAKDRTFKPRDKVQRKDYIEKLVYEAYKLLLERVFSHAREYPKQYIVAILDETDVRHHITSTFFYTAVFGKYTSEMPASKRVILPPIFADSRLYRGLQLADVIAYITHRVYSGRGDPAGGLFPISSLFRQVKECILRKSGTSRVEGYGLKEWQFIYHKRFRL